MLEHLTSDMEIIRLFHVVLIAYWGIATYSDVLISRLDFLFMISAFDRSWAIDTLGLVFSTYLDDLRYLPIFHFVLRHFTLDIFMLSILPNLDHYLLLSHTSHHDTWPHTTLLIRGRCRSVLDFLGCVFIHLVDFRFNIFHDGRAWQIVDLLVMML